MIATQGETNGILNLSEALYGFVREESRQVALCKANEKTTAIHTRGSALQLYRMYRRDANAIDFLRKVTESLPSWEEHPRWDWEGKVWQKAENSVKQSMERNPKKLPILTRGLAFKGMPVLMHAYKFEPDDVYKVEIAPMDSGEIDDERVLQTVARTIECHEHLQPKEIIEPLPPYERHETEFETINEYLSHTLPREMYNFYGFTELSSGVEKENWN